MDVVGNAIARHFANAGVQIRLYVRAYNGVSGF
jgi:hypothetical protein